jgi:hypothetical protein
MAAYQQNIFLCAYMLARSASCIFAYRMKATSASCLAAALVIGVDGPMMIGEDNIATAACTRST